MPRSHIVLKSLYYLLVFMLLTALPAGIMYLSINTAWLSEQKNVLWFFLVCSGVIVSIALLIITLILGEIILYVIKKQELI